MWFKLPESHWRRIGRVLSFRSLIKKLMMESPLKNIKEQVTCSICLDTFTDPKTITCLHTFCFQCLKKHALISQRNGKFLCPECQAEVDLPEANRFDKLPTSFHHNSLLSVLTIRQSGKGIEMISDSHLDWTSDFCHRLAFNSSLLKPSKFVHPRSNIQKDKSIKNGR